MEERLEGGRSCPQEREVDKTFFLSPVLSMYHLHHTYNNHSRRGIDTSVKAALEVSDAYFVSFHIVFCAMS